MTCSIVDLYTHVDIMRPAPNGARNLHGCRHIMRRFDAKAAYGKG